MSAAILGETVVHPIDTVITRMQSSVYASQYKNVNGSLKRKLFLGLYQGFGPCLIASLPSSAVFFATYEASKAAFEKARKAGHVGNVPPWMVFAASSAAAELLACAITNPAEVLKQNAQVLQPAGRSSLAHVSRLFRKDPSKLWAGYWLLVAGQLPGVCLTFCFYESLKAGLLSENNPRANEPLHQVKISALSAAVAGGCSSWIFVPIDVMKTRMRLAAGDRLNTTPSHVDKARNASTTTVPSSRHSRLLATASQIARQEGVLGFFRGSTLTCVAAALGSGLYLGCYEGVKLYFSAIE